jgi:nicotinamide-nucleotide amidase
MVAEIICVGTEILLGNIVNTNAHFMAERLSEAGLTCYYQTAVGDNPKRMSDTIRTALKRSDIVLINGGLGPTEDDLTIEIAAKVLKRKLVEDPKTLSHIKKSVAKYVRSNKRVTATANNWKMALIPEGSETFQNANGQAPGIVMEENGKCVILLPGPPNELLPMFDEQVMPYLRKKQDRVLVSRTAKIVELGESMVADRITDLYDAQTNPTIATYAKTGEVHVRMTASAATESEAGKLLRPMTAEMKKRFGDLIFTFDEKVTLEESIVRTAAKKKLTLTCAESCTGGMIASRIVNVPGASDVLMQGLVTYSNDAKRKYLGVRESTLSEHGAVSAETAEEMSRGGCRKTGTDLCIASTGIAGPGGGTKEKPVGLVFISCCCRGEVRTEELHLGGNRMKIRTTAAQRALVLLRRCLTDAEVVSNKL